MKENLLISPLGNDSLCHTWVSEKSNFDSIFLCYENLSKENKIKYLNLTPHIYKGKGPKFQLIKAFIESNKELINKYKFIWLPDDDVSISVEDINTLYKTANDFNLEIAQPSMDGYVSHNITRPVEGNILRYTNFVEVLAPLFSLKSLLKLYHSFNFNYSSFGYDFYWPFSLGYPKNKMAILDNITMTHTKPVGGNYDRYIKASGKTPGEEMNELLHKFNINPTQKIYSNIC